MACCLPHSVEEMQVYIQKQCDKDDAAWQKAIIDVINQYQLVKKKKKKKKKKRLRQRYTKCKDISAERQVVIDQIFSDEAKKDNAIVHEIIFPTKTSINLHNFSEIKILTKK